MISSVVYHCLSYLYILIVVKYVYTTILYLTAYTVDQ